MGTISDVNSNPLVRFFFAVTVCSLFLLGCMSMSTKAVLLDPSGDRYPPVGTEQVRIFASEEELNDYEYIQIALITSTGSASLTSRSEMIESIRKKAGELGANAIVMPKMHEASDTVQIAAAVLGVDTSRKGEVIALRILGKKTQ